jgi:hypothetical protein
LSKPQFYESDFRKAVTAVWSFWLAQRKHYDCLWGLLPHSLSAFDTSNWVTTCGGGGLGIFPLLHRVQTSSGAHPAPYPMGTEDSFPRVNRPEREADHSPPSSVEVKNVWRYTSTPQYVFMAR